MKSKQFYPAEKVISLREEIIGTLRLMQPKQAFNIDPQERAKWQTAISRLHKEKFGRYKTVRTQNGQIAIIRIS